MKSAILLAIAIVTLSSLPVVSHRNDVEAQESAGNQSARAQAHGPYSASAIMLPIHAELVRFSAESAKVGAPVTAITTETISTAGGNEIPKGSRLTGRVTNIVQASGKPHINLTFDRAESTNGQSIPIHLDSGSPLVLGRTEATPR